MEGLHVFMAIIGFASVLPVSLPFQVYSMAMGGVTHAGMLVATFEFVVHFVEAGLDLLVGQLLEERRYATWLGINCLFALLGTIAMALFYWLDWRRAPSASTLVAAPDLNTKDKASIGRAMMFSASQAQAPEEARMNTTHSILEAMAPMSS